MVSSIPLTQLVEQEDHTRWESGIPSQKAGPNAASANKSQQASTEDLQVFLLTLHYICFISILPLCLQKYLSSISTHELLVSQVRKEEHGWLPATIFLEGI